MSVNSITFILCIISLSGCSISYVDGDGAFHQIGFLSVTEKPGSCSIVRTVASAGVGLDATPGILIGYKSTTTTRLSEQGTFTFIVNQEGQVESFEQVGRPESLVNISCK